MKNRIFTMTERSNLDNSSSDKIPIHKPYKKDLPWHQDYIPWLSLTTSHLRESRLLCDDFLASVLIFLKSSNSKEEVGKRSGPRHQNRSSLSCITCVSLSWCNLRPSTPEQVLWPGFIDLMSFLYVSVLDIAAFSGGLDSAFPWLCDSNPIVFPNHWIVSIGKCSGMLGYISFTQPTFGGQDCDLYGYETFRHTWLKSVTQEIDKVWGKRWSNSTGKWKWKIDGRRVSTGQKDSSHPV